MLDLRTCDPIDDRAAARRVIHDAFTRDDVGYTIHPGEWDWWRFHADFGRPAPTLLMNDRVLVDLEAHNGDLMVYGATPDELVEIIEGLGDDVRAVGWVLESDEERKHVLRGLGFVPADGDPGPVFERPTAGAPAVAPLPDGFVIRPVAGLDEAPLRSAAARRSFATKMEPETHVARYRAFMQSPAYERERDLVVFDETQQRIASFAVHWVDAGLSLAQFEPVGTDPDYQQRGLGRRLLFATFERLVSEGIRTIRVTTFGNYTAAIALYESCGFPRTGALRDWVRR
jgi:ribosomal protein S18 acetylase RimI-like enzyme